MASGQFPELLDAEEEARRVRAFAFHALGSEARLKLLRELLQGDRDVADLSEAVGLHPVTVRYHLNILVGDGLVQKMTTPREGEVGRPPILYRLRQKELVESFPPRRYEMLSEILLSVVGASMGEEEARRVLFQAGLRTGEDLIKALEQEGGISHWTPDRFARAYVEGAMAAMGLVASVVEQGEDSVQYRSFVCPFQELALKYPDKICDHLDAGFHQGIANALGPEVVHERLACIGHGDPHCEYRVRWKSGKEETE